MPLECGGCDDFPNALDGEIPPPGAQAKSSKHSLKNAPFFAGTKTDPKKSSRSSHLAKFWISFETSLAGSTGEGNLRKT